MGERTKEKQCYEFSNFGLHIMTAYVVFRILPQDVNCPGGINAWDTVTFYVNNQSCEGQRNICNSTEDPGMLSHLHPSGNYPSSLVFSTLDQDGKIA